MPEQSVGMTSGTGDATVGGYLNTRMVQKDRDNLGSGVLLNNQPSITYPTGGVQISACAFNVQGYYYQNTTAITITTTGVAAGTYNLVCRVNDTGTAETVIRSASGTTIPLRSVRLCLVSAIDTARDVYLAVVDVAGGNASGIDQWPLSIEQSPSISQPFTVLLNKTTTQNITGAPAISLPMGLSQANLPIGIQFAAPLGEEALLLALAFELEATNTFKNNVMEHSIQPMKKVKQ